MDDRLQNLAAEQAASCRDSARQSTRQQSATAVEEAGALQSAEA